MINKALDLPFAEPEETYSTSEHLYTELEIPRTATGRLPRAQRTREGLDAEEIEDLGETGRRKPPAGTGGGGGGKDRPRSGGRSRTRSGSAEKKTTGETATPRKRRRTRRGGAAGTAGDGAGSAARPVDPPA
jgi:hypothetical protein